MYFTPIMIFLLFCNNYYTTALSKIEFLNSRKEGPYQLNITQVSDCKPNPPPNSPVILRNISLIRENLVAYEFDIVGNTKNVKLNLKAGYLNDNVFIPIFNFSNIGCRSSFAIAFLSFFPLHFTGNDCACKKESLKGNLNMNDLYHKIKSVIWYGYGKFHMELVTKKNGEVFFCIQGLGSVNPLSKS